MNNIRKSNMELLRIIAMFGIVMAHYIGWTPHVAEMFSIGNKQTLYLTILTISGKVGVHLMFLISGYFLIKSDFKFERIIKTWKLTWVYSLLLFVFAVLFGLTSLNITNVFQNLFPILRENYWFITTYTIIIMCSSAVNDIIKKISQKKLIIFLIFICGFYYVLNFFGKWYLNMDFDFSGRIFTYVLAYATGAALSLYPPKLKWRTIIIFFITILLFHIIWRYIVIYNLNVRGFNLWVADDNGLEEFGMAFTLFLIFTRLDIKHNKYINLISGTTFAVYLISENAYIRPIIWKFFDIFSVFGTRYLYIYAIVIPILVFAGCSMIEILRQFTVKIAKKILTKIRAKTGKEKLPEVKAC